MRTDRHIDAFFMLLSLIHSYPLSLHLSSSLTLSFLHLVVMNDVSAYFCGISMGKRFIQTPFLALSPKKTWEGFLGGGVLTCIFSFFFPVLLAQFPWFTCPADKLTFIPPALDSIQCIVNPIFLPKQYALPSLVRTVMGVLGGQVPHTVMLLPIQLHGIAYGLFASIVAPFGEESYCMLPWQHITTVLYVCMYYYIVSMYHTYLALAQVQCTWSVQESECTGVEHTYITPHLITL